MATPEVPTYVDIGAQVNVSTTYANPDFGFRRHFVDVVPVASWAQENALMVTREAVIDGYPVLGPEAENIEARFRHYAEAMTEAAERLAAPDSKPEDGKHIISRTLAGMALATVLYWEEHHRYISMEAAYGREAVQDKNKKGYYEHGPLMTNFNQSLGTSEPPRPIAYYHNHTAANALWRQVDSSLWYTYRDNYLGYTVQPFQALCLPTIHNIAKSQARSEGLILAETVESRIILLGIKRDHRHLRRPDQTGERYLNPHRRQRKF